MKRNGFTLVEIIAVISVIAILLLITVPIITGISRNSRERAFGATANGIIETAKIYNTERNLTAIRSDRIMWNETAGGGFGTLTDFRFENMPQINMGFICYNVERERYIIFVRSDNFCAYSDPDNPGALVIWSYNRRRLNTGETDPTFRCGRAYMNSARIRNQCV